MGLLVNLLTFAPSSLLGGALFSKSTDYMDILAKTNINPIEENSTKNHQSITETHYLPTNLNFEQTTRNYTNGVLTFRVPKANPIQLEIEGTKDTGSKETDSKGTGPKDA